VAPKDAAIAATETRAPQRRALLLIGMVFISPSRSTRSGAMADCQDDATASRQPILYQLFHHLSRCETSVSSRPLPAVVRGGLIQLIHLGRNEARQMSHCAL
jgi:hypothetical protein